MTEAEMLTTLTVDIITSYVANNSVSVNDISDLINSTYQALAQAGTTPKAIDAPFEYAPAVTARKSLSNPDVIISMIDGKPYKMLKRHLGLNGLTPAEYRERFNLPDDYPMTAATYSQARRDLALKIGLGNQRRKTSQAGRPKAASNATAKTGAKPKPAA